MKKLCLSVLLLLSFAFAARAETLYAGPADSGFASITEALSAAEDGDEIILANGVYTEAGETFPLIVDKAITIRPADGAAPVIVTPKQATAMKISGAGATISGIRFEHIRCAVWVLADDVTITGSEIDLIDENWRTSSCGIWIAGAKRLSLNNNAFNGCGIAVAGPPISESSVGIPVLTAMFEVGEDIEYFTSHTITNNTVNGKPLRYLVGVKNMRCTDEAGQIVAVQCEDVTFEGLNVDYASIGIQIAYCNRISVADCQANDNGIFGVYVMKTSDCRISGTMANRGAHGIDVRDAERVVILDCVTNECGQGTFLSWGRNCFIQILPPTLLVVFALPGVV